MKKQTILVGLVSLFGGLFLGSGVAFGQAAALRAVSPISESMAGAVTAAPVDAAGALYWNPGSISGVQGDDISINFGMVFPKSTLGSSVTLPGIGTISGETKSDAGMTPVPSMAAIKHITNTPWTIGLGISGIAGASCNYPGVSPIISPTGINRDTNPILSSSMVGRLSANVQVFQIAPTAAYQVTDKLSVGFAPTVTLANMMATPLFIAPADSTGMWAQGAGSHFTWGGGFQCGAYYRTDAAWDFGLSFKSPQWMKDFHFFYMQNGQGKEIKYGLDYPMIVSLGTAYRGLNRWLFTGDVRYFNWSGARGFGNQGYGPGHQVLGFGWKDNFSFSFGSAFQMTEKLTLRGGYCYSNSAIDDEVTIYNIASSLSMEHSVHVGATYDVGDQWLLSGSYTYVFPQTLHGALDPVTGAGEVWTKSSAHAAWTGISKRF